MKAIARAVLGFGAVLFCTSLAAQQVASAEMRLEISSQPRELALQQLSEQSGLQVLFLSEQAAMREAAPALMGLHTTRQALDYLLNGTDLKYVYVNSRTVAISERRVSSRDGYIIFDDAELRDIVEEFNRYTSRKIVI